MRTRQTFGRAALLVGLGLLLAAASSARAEDYKVDPVHSSLVFRSKHFGVGYIFGRFNEFSGTFRLDDKNAANSAIEMEVKAGSIDTNFAKRDAHLKGPDFFNVKQFPTIAFKSTSFKKVDDAHYEVTGDLTLHGVAKPVTVKLERVGSGKDPMGTYRTGLETTFTIKRSDFDMKFMLEGIGDEVRITLAVEGMRQ
jgi:polyisoprenoid-binding protein YceI